MFWLSVLLSVAVALFAIFPLTDTDIWWHLACAREWVATWTPVREPVVNVHEYFQQIVAFVYDVGGAPLLVAFKALLWGVVFAFFLRGEKCRNLMAFAFFAVLLFVFRYQFEIRPVLFSLLFLGIYWNLLPGLFSINAGVRGTSSAEWRESSRKGTISKSRLFASAAIVLAIQWLWCKFQGLYILGPLFALLVFVSEWMGCHGSAKADAPSARKILVIQAVFVVLLFSMPFLHNDGLNLFLYPFGLLDRLLGLSPSATIFASEIAENRSPITLLLNGENVLQSAVMLVLCAFGLWHAYRLLRLCCLSWRKAECRVAISRPLVLGVSFLVTAILSLVAERNFVLFLPVFFAVGIKCMPWSCPCKHARDAQSTLLPNFLFPSANRQLPTFYFLLPTLLIAFTLGLWARSLAFYDRSMVAYQRVPVAATQWMLENPHSGRIFNDDRAGGYLAFMNPSDSTYIDGRFILKTADFFERYLEYAKMPQFFLRDADSLEIDRVVLPLRYYARWDKLIESLDSHENWHVAYRDSFFVVMDRTGH
jgi:hypothetical protein